VSMDWSIYFSDDETDDRPVTAVDENSLPLVPDGTHVGEVKWCGFKDVDFDWAKAPNNPTGHCLRLKICVANYRPVWADIPCHFTGKVSAVCASARVEPPTKANPKWHEGDIVGKFVTIETVLKVSASGREYVRIDKWKPGPPMLPKSVKAAEPAAAKQRATTAQKITSQLPDDDIPF